MTPRKSRHYILVLPSIFTTGNLFCGFFAIINSFSHHFEKASFAIFFAGLFDVLDGRVARMTQTQSKFGVEYDSIADVVSFGLAPAVLTYVWVLEPYGRLGWAGSFFFAACGALRLARFNTISSELPKSYFVGLPIPAAANMVAATFLAYDELQFPYVDYVMLAAMFLLGSLMVSTVRFRSFKDFDLRHPRSFFYLVMVVLVFVAFAWKYEVAWAVLIGLYIAWGPLREGLSWLRRLNSKSPAGETTNREKTGGS
ncbi:MAG: CDP-diacylglycerol--serine O-phosphatidyltransferase [Proteobacteria bacterium]|nr:CDP-diacylglycerol--serine O-phosphatidyltransferase [Pseudomonadota bacterium]